MQISNLLYSLGDFFSGTGKQAQKAFFNRRINSEINKGAIYIDTSVPYDLYNTIPELKIPVDKIASMYSNGIFKLRKIGTEEVIDLPPEWDRLFNKPNVLQAQNPMMNQYIRQLIIYGNQFQYKNQPSKLAVPKSIMNISASRVKPILTGKEFDQISMDGIVKNYECTEGGKARIFETNQILWSKIADLDSNIEGCSPLKSLQYPLTNTKLAYQYFGCISGEKGNIGILSTSPSKDSMGALPTTPEQKKELESIYREENGIGDNQKKIHITSASVTWQPMTYPTKDLLLQEQIDSNFLRNLYVFGVNRNLFSDSTYENLKNGLVQTHNDTIVPYADGYTQGTELWLCEGRPENRIKPGYELFLSYSHLPYLQSNRKEEADTFNSVSSALKSLVDGQIISAAQANAILSNQFGIDMTAKK